MLFSSRFHASQLHWWRKSKYPEKATVFSKSLTNFISLYNFVSNTLAKCRNHITFEAMGTDCIGNCKANYHMITVLESDLCCICHKRQPKELINIDVLVIKKWSQCAMCSHWTHLVYCSPVILLRLNVEFSSPHCTD